LKKVKIAAPLRRGGYFTSITENQLNNNTINIKNSILKSLDLVIHLLSEANRFALLSKQYYTTKKRESQRAFSFFSLLYRPVEIQPAVVFVNFASIEINCGL
jgi:hypothetical protein